MIKVIGLALIENREGKVLAVKSKKSIVGQEYVPPGGKLHEDETIRECIIREVKEELNIDISLFGVTAVAEEEYQDGIWLFVMYKAKIVKGQPAIMEPDNIEGLKWICKTELKNYNKIYWTKK